MDPIFYTFNGGIILGLLIVLPIWGIIALTNYIRRRIRRRKFDKAWDEIMKRRIARLRK
jgi:hypothetical protein